MTEEHERIEELLAGHALGALPEEDRAEAERLLAEHVPGCETCRVSLQAFLELSGDLALASSPASPPELLWPRLRQQVAGSPSPRRRRPLTPWGFVAGVAAVVAGLVAWNTVLNDRLSHEVESQKHLSSALSTIADPTSTKLRLDSATEPTHHMEAAYYTREAHLSIVGVGIPDPAPGHVYRVWLLGPNGNVRVADFRPDDGLVVLNLVVDATRFTHLVITEERSGPPARGPSGIQRWTTGL